MARNVTGLPPRPRRTAQVQVPIGGGARFRAVFGRALRRRCPYCGGGGIFKNWFDLKETCPTCQTRFEREHGYFLGGYALNLIVAEFVAVGLFALIWVLFDPSVLVLQIVAAGLAGGLPFLFYPWSRTFWIALDLQVHPPGRDD